MYGARLGPAVPVELGYSRMLTIPRLDVAVVQNPACIDEGNLVQNWRELHLPAPYVHDARSEGKDRRIVFLEIATVRSCRNHLHFDAWLLRPCVLALRCDMPDGARVRWPVYIYLSMQRWHACTNTRLRNSSGPNVK